LTSDDAHSLKEVSRIVLYGVACRPCRADLPGWPAGFDRRFTIRFETLIGREIAILVVGAIFASIMSFQWQRRKKAASKIAKVSPPRSLKTTPASLKDKMKDALATLKTASRGKRDFLYDLPWYVLIGPPGSGKNHRPDQFGSQVPALRGATPAAIAGVGGTRYCDWCLPKTQS